MERAKAAGHEISVGCERGHHSDNLCHRLLRCQKTEVLRATHFSVAALQRLGEPPSPGPPFTSW
eukprot:3492690-Pyramimonas_sp.AAC.1